MLIRNHITPMIMPNNPMLKNNPNPASLVKRTESIAELMIMNIWLLDHRNVTSVLRDIAMPVYIAFSSFVMQVSPFWGSRFECATLSSYTKLNTKCQFFLNPGRSKNERRRTSFCKTARRPSGYRAERKSRSKRTGEPFATSAGSSAKNQNVLLWSIYTTTLKPILWKIDERTDDEQDRMPAGTRGETNDEQKFSGLGGENFCR